MSDGKTWTTEALAVDDFGERYDVRIGVATDTGLPSTTVAICNVEHEALGDPVDEGEYQIGIVEAEANARLFAAAALLFRALELYDVYEATPADRGGSNGAKGRAYTEFVAMKGYAMRLALDGE